MAYDIWLRNYPQPDENLAETFEEGFTFETLEKANKAIKELEEYYDSEYWQGHPLHKAKFYAEETGKWN